MGGFWSYVHADDDAEFGRITALGRDLAVQYEMLTGEAIELFLDRDALEWGNAWRAKVDGSLASVAFFIPVITPRYFQSAECRRELRSFATQAQRLGLTELLMPLLYVDFAGLHGEKSTDELIETVKGFQWEDWIQARFLERESGEYRRRVVAMAERLYAANVEAATASTAASPEATAAAIGEIDESPGLMDRVAEMEIALPEWSKIVERVGDIVVDLGRQMDEAQVEMAAADARGKGFVGRLTVTRSLAHELSAPGDEVVSLGNDFVQRLNEVDGGIRAIIEMAAQSVQADPEEKDGILEFFETIRELAVSVHDGLGSIDDFLTQVEPLERMSRDLRAPLRKFRQGLTLMLEAVAMSDEWVGLVDDSPVSAEAR